METFPFRSKGFAINGPPDEVSFARMAFRTLVSTIWELGLKFPTSVVKLFHTLHNKLWYMCCSTFYELWML
jgi:hypothetical protein